MLVCLQGYVQCVRCDCGGDRLQELNLLESRRKIPNRLIAKMLFFKKKKKNVFLSVLLEVLQ